MTRVDVTLDTLRAIVAEVFPGSVVRAVTELGKPESSALGACNKVFGYGVPLRLDVVEADGTARALVFHTQTANDFGHDRRADRAALALLSFDTFGAIPAHVAPLDVGALGTAGEAVSLRRGGEFYLLTSYADGDIYAHDLERVAQRGVAEPRDLSRVETLARYLARLHREERPRREGYVRALRDLLGSGEGIFGLVDAYPEDTPSAPRSRLVQIEHACLDYRHRLRGRGDRLRRTHGDFHPFNLVFSDAGELTVLDTSRGSEGDPADDAICLSINYPFFALDTADAWRGLGPLYRRFWDVYLDESRDLELLTVAPPFLAWRALVLACPRWYPKLSAASRDALLGLVEAALSTGRFEPSSVEALFR
ncbi:MAG: phosphotransferase [Polyangiaceae bacterium]